MEVNVSTVTSKGQVTIPKEIREALHLTEGDKILFIRENGEVTLRKAGGETLTDILRRAKPWRVDAVEYQRRLREEWRE